MAKFKPPTLNLASSLADGFDVKSFRPAAVESLRFSPTGVQRTKDDATFSVEINSDDLIFLRTLGTGASSIVKKALLVRQGGALLPRPRYVAVKRISNLNEELRAQMRKDVSILMDATRARAAAAAPMDGLVAFEGAFMDTGSEQASIVLEYMDGGSLEDVLKHRRRVPEAVLARVAALVLRGLVLLHKAMHIVHRDIKPANILLSLDGGAKISDFGISRPLDNTLAVCETWKGTQNYMSPERIEGAPYGFASDVWSLGLTLLECATGEYPYDTSGGPITTMTYILRDEVPLPPAGEYSAELRAFCARCLQKAPQDRATVVQLLQEPFVARQCSAAELAAFMRSAVSPHAVLDEAAFLFVHQMYQTLNRALGGAADAAAALAPLYGGASVRSLRAGGAAAACVARGRARITEQLRTQLAALRAAGARHLRVHEVDCAGMAGGEGGVLLHVRGELEGDGAAGAFAEMLVLEPRRGAGGGFGIANQAFTVLRTE